MAGFERIMILSMIGIADKQGAGDEKTCEELGSWILTFRNLRRLDGRTQDSVSGLTDGKDFQSRDVKESIGPYSIRVGEHQTTKFLAISYA